MPDRITRSTVDRLAHGVEMMLPTNTYLVAQGRNGYTGLDLCYLEDGAMRVARTLRLGTKREIYEYLHAMREGILLSREEA